MTARLDRKRYGPCPARKLLHRRLIDGPVVEITDDTLMADGKFSTNCTGTARSASSMDDTATTGRESSATVGSVDDGATATAGAALFGPRSVRAVSLNMYPTNSAATATPPVAATDSEGVRNQSRNSRQRGVGCGVRPCTADNTRATACASVGGNGLRAALTRSMASSRSSCMVGSVKRSGRRHSTEPGVRRMPV